MWMSVSKGTPSKPKVKQLSMWLVEQLSKGIDLQNACRVINGLWNSLKPLFNKSRFPRRLV